MNEHKTASFVAKIAWAALILMEVALFAGLPLRAGSGLPLVFVVTIALVASAICAEGRPPK